MSLADHVGPRRRALETVDDLPVTAVGKPVVGRFVEEFVYHVGTRNFGAGEIGNAHADDAGAGADGAEAARQAVAENGLAGDVDPQPVAFMVEFVFQRINAFSFRSGERAFLHDGVFVFEFLYGKDELAVFDDDGDGAVVGVIWNGDVEIAVRDARQFDVEIGEEIAFMPHGVGLACDPLAFRGGPMAHEAVRLEDGILLLKFFYLNAFRVQLEIGENGGRALRCPDGVGADEIVAALPDEDEFAVFQCAELAFFRGVQHKFEGCRFLFSVRQSMFERFDDFVLLAGRGGIKGVGFGGVVRLAGDGETGGGGVMGGPFSRKAERPAVALRLDGRFENAINGLRASESEQGFVCHRDLWLLFTI